MKLYYNPISTYSHKALIALYEKKASFTREIVNLGDAESRAAYAKVYPLGKVPFLVLDDGYKIPESTIIIEYLEGHLNTGTRLIPEGTDPARKTRFHDRMSDLYINNAGMTLVFDKYKIVEVLPAEVAQAKQYLDTMYGFYDQHLANSKWMIGDDFTMADCATIPPLFYLEQLHPFKDRPNIQRYWEDAKQRQSYRQVLEEVQPAWEAMTKR